MKAIRIHEFGGPEVMKLEDVERSAPAADEILDTLLSYSDRFYHRQFITREKANH